MPELPEVETFVKSLTSGGMTGSPILNRPILFASLYWEKTLAAQDAGDFTAWFVGKSVAEVTRRGKYLMLRIDDRFLLIHLRMSGDLRTVPATGAIGKHDRFSLTFVDGERLVFRDPRKFGRIWLTQGPETVLAKLGVEPLSGALTADYLRVGFTKSARPVKSLLLDQGFIAGLGNIYTDEALFRAGIIHKRRRTALPGWGSNGLRRSGARFRTRFPKGSAGTAPVSIGSIAAAIFRIISASMVKKANPVRAAGLKSSGSSSVSAERISAPAASRP